GAGAVARCTAGLCSRRWGDRPSDDGHPRAGSMLRVVRVLRADHGAAADAPAPAGRAARALARGGRPPRLRGACPAGASPGVCRGMSLPEGLSALALRGPEPLRPAFARFSAAYRASGRFGECLDALKDDLADPVGDRVCETMRVAREVGGSDLGTVLGTLSE